VVELKEDLNNVWSTRLKWSFLQVWCWDLKFRAAKLVRIVRDVILALVSLEITKIKIQARKWGNETRYKSDTEWNGAVRRWKWTTAERLARAFNCFLLPYIELLCSRIILVETHLQNEIIKPQIRRNVSDCSHIFTCNLRRRGLSNSIDYCAPSNIPRVSLLKIDIKLADVVIPSEQKLISSLYLYHLMLFLRTQLEREWISQIVVFWVFASFTLHGVTTEKTTIWTQTAVKISNLRRVEMKMVVFWDVVPRSLVSIDRNCRGAYCLHHQGDHSCTNPLYQFPYLLPRIYVRNNIQVTNKKKIWASLSTKCV
jgi:hypothetical protein